MNIIGNRLLIAYAIEEVGGVGRSWVAEITGLNDVYVFARKFLRPVRDYGEANSVGTRGVVALYMLREAAIYEFAEPNGHKTVRRYFGQVRDGQVVKLTGEEVIACLSEKARLRSASMS